MKNPLRRRWAVGYNDWRTGMFKSEKKFWFEWSAKSWLREVRTWNILAGGARLGVRWGIKRLN